MERDFRNLRLQDPNQAGAALRSEALAQIYIEPDFQDIQEQLEKSLWATCSKCSFHVNDDEGLEEEVSSRKCK